MKLFSHLRHSLCCQKASKDPHCKSALHFLINIFLHSDKQVEGLEDHKPTYNSQVDWELDDYTKQRLIELGLEKPAPKDDGSEFISRL